MSCSIVARIMGDWNNAIYLALLAILTYLVFNDITKNKDEK
jgi:hypothetical protein